MAERLPRGTFHRERRTLMQMVERPQHGVFLPGRQIHTQAEVGAEVDGAVGVGEEAEEAEEVGTATAGEVRHPEGRTIILMTGRRILG